MNNKSIMKKRTLLKMKYIAACATVGVIFSIFMQSVGADGAADKVKKAITSAGTDAEATGKVVGAVIAGVIAVVSGVVLLIIAGMAIWDVMRNSGQNDIMGQHGGKVGWLVALTAFAGAIAAAFAFS